MSFLILFFLGILLCPVASAQINASFFPFKDVYLVKGLLTDVAVLNLTKDTLQDVIVADYANDNITIFENVGGCPNSLSLKSYLPAGDGPVAFQTGDFNQDDREEFVVLNALSHTVSVYKNYRSPQGAVSILPAGTYSLRDSCNAMLANDIDGDGKTDLLITHGNSGLVYVLKNTSTMQTIQFGLPVLLFSTGMNLNGLCAEDFNGDGKSDLALAGTWNGNGHLVVVQNQSSPGNISFLSPLDYTIDISPSVLQTGDIDADGKPDLVAGGKENGNLMVLHNEFSGGPLSLHTFAPPLYFETLAGIGDIELADLNDDYQLDVVVLHPLQDSLTILTNACFPGTWNESLFMDKEKVWSGERPLALCVKDLNGDGRKDILHTNQEFRNLSVQYKKNTVRGSTNMTFPPSAANYYSRYNPGDFILTGFASGVLTWYEDSTLYHLMGTGNQFHTPWLEHTDTFYVTNSEFCNESDPVAVIASIRCSILPPQPVSAYRCGAGSLTLEALSNEQICWYKNYAKDTIVLARGSVFSIPYLEASDTFYVAAIKNECRSQRVAVVASIFPVMHVAEVKAETGICSSNGVQVYLPFSQQGVNYYVFENETPHLYKGNGDGLLLGNYPIGTSLHVTSATPCDSITLPIKYQNSQQPLIPNLLTVNNDGKNEDFSILNLPEASRIAIYNNWGALIFSSDDYQNNWGNKEKNGIYFYELQYELCGKIQDQSGWFQVISEQ